MPSLREKHIQIGQYLKDVVFAANDGVITTFAVVAGVAGAELSVAVVLIIGFANLIADGFSMATGNYLGTKSEKELYSKERLAEMEEIKTLRGRETEEVRVVLKDKGYEGEKLEKLTKLIIGNEEYWADFMMSEELGLFEPASRSPLKHALATFVSFVLIGCVPLLPYVISGNSASFIISAAASGAALFAVGATRKYFSTRSWLISGLEMLFVGGIAAVFAYAIGAILKSVIG